MPLDFLAMQPLAADELLRQYRDRMDGSRSERLPENAVVLLATLDGGIQYQRKHSDFITHFIRFTGAGRQILERNRGLVLPANLDGSVAYLLCSWFSVDGQDAVNAAADLHQHLRKVNDSQKCEWDREQHAQIGIGRQEYAAFRMLQLAKRGQTMVDPQVWSRLPPGMDGLLEKFDIQPPNFAQTSEEIGAEVRSTVKVALQAYRLQLKPKPTDCGATEPSSMVGVAG